MKTKKITLDEAIQEIAECLAQADPNFIAFAYRQIIGRSAEPSDDVADESILIVEEKE